MRGVAAVAFSMVFLSIPGTARAAAQDARDASGLVSAFVAGRGGGSNTVTFLGGNLGFPLFRSMRGSFEWTGWHGTGSTCEGPRGCVQEVSRGSMITGGVEIHAPPLGLVRPLAEFMVGVLKDPLGPSERAPIALGGGGAYMDVTERWVVRTGLRYVSGISSDDVDQDGHRLNYWLGLLGVAYRWPGSAGP